MNNGGMSQIQSVHRASKMSHIHVIQSMLCLYVSLAIVDPIQGRRKEFFKGEGGRFKC